MASLCFVLSLWPVGLPKGTIPDSKVHWAYMGPTWGRQDPGGSHVSMNLAIRARCCAKSANPGGQSLHRNWTGSVSLNVGNPKSWFMAWNISSAGFHRTKAHLLWKRDNSNEYLMIWVTFNEYLTFTNLTFALLSLDVFPFHRQWH